MLDQIEQLVTAFTTFPIPLRTIFERRLADYARGSKELALIRPAPEETFAEIDGAVADVDRVIRIFDAAACGWRRSMQACAVPVSSRWMLPIWPPTPPSFTNLPPSSRTSSYRF